MSRYWVIAPYASRNADIFERIWRYDLENGTIAVGWTDLVDVSNLDEDELWKRIEETYPDRTERSRTIDYNSLWNFFHEMKKGDKIIARRGRMAMLAIGTVTGLAYYDEKQGKERVGGLTDVYYPNFISVDWQENCIEYDWLAFAMNTITGPFGQEYYDRRVEDYTGEVPDTSGQEHDRFRLESHLEDFIVTNFERVFGIDYELYVDDDGTNGKQYPATNDEGTVIGRIDILARNKHDGSYMVIELKRDYGVEKVIGQILWYMGWVRTNLCREGQDVKGLIICTNQDERLEYALEMVSDIVNVKYYTVAFQLHEEPQS